MENRIEPFEAGNILREEGSFYRRKEDADGSLSIAEHSVFPGIWLIFRDVRRYSFANHAAWPDHLLEITHCREGRLEFRDRNRSFFLGEGDMSIHKSSRDPAVLCCPTRRYHGLSVVIDPERAPQCTSCLLGDVEVQLPELRRKFCGDGGYFIMRSTPALEHIFSQLYQVPEQIRKGYFKVKVLELLLFLSSVEPDMSVAGKRACTQAQAELAREVLRYVRENQGRRVAARELAEAFHVSQEQLRGSMQRVYGKPLYQCLRIYKMKLAAEELCRTDRTVMDIAGEFGYDNSSKFAGAFREVFGLSPSVYRRVRAGTEEGPVLE